MIGTNKALQALLETESDARQIRSARGRVLVSNKKGRQLFKETADPFHFLKETTQQSVLEKLKSAYAQKCPTSVQLEVEDKTYRVTLKKVNNTLLLIGEDLTDEFEILSLMRQEQATLQESIDTLPVGLYIVDSEGCIQFMNDVLCHWIDQKPEDVKGHHLQEIIKGLLPDMSGAWSGTVLFKAGKKTISAKVYQTSFDQDGETMFQSVVIKNEDPQAPTAFNTPGSTDFFQNAPLGMVVIDAMDLSVLDANIAFQKIINKPFELLKDQSFLSFIDSESKETLPLKLSKLLMRAQKFEKCELTFTLPKGQTRSVIAFIAPIQPKINGIEETDVSSFVLYLTDSSERKNLEMQMAHAQKMQAMGQLAGGVAHDFNNLLTAIIGFSDLLLQKHTMGDPSFADIMQIKHNANRASALVGQLLAFSRKQPLKPRLVDIADAFSELTALLHRSIGPKVELKTQHAPELGYVKVDPNQLTQVFLNLAVNARDAMPDGGTLTIKSKVETIKKARTVGSDVMIPGTYVVITVADTGCGIAPENLPRIFEPFFSTKEGIAGSGTGLGLSTVYGIITQTDGYIHVDSTPGKGTTFTIYLPRFTQNTPMPAKDKPVAHTFPTSSATILLVEDEDAVRAFSSRVLKNKGFTVTECTDGDHALKEMEKGTHFDLLLTDMMMPGMDGETLAELAKERYPDIRVILMSGYSEDFARHGKDESQTFSFLPKPFSLSQLTQKVREVLQEKN